LEPVEQVEFLVLQAFLVVTQFFLLLLQQAEVMEVKEIQIMLQPVDLVVVARVSIANLVKQVLQTKVTPVVMLLLQRGVAAVQVQ
jgi:hypothetical protein